MKADKKYYLAHRYMFQAMQLHYEVAKLDAHFKVQLLISKSGKLIKIY